VRRYARVYVVEQNRDGQLAELLRLELPNEGARILSVRHYTGMPIDARFVTDTILAMERGRSGPGGVEDAREETPGLRHAATEGAPR
jgi:hypothetical protein